MAYNVTLEESNKILKDDPYCQNKLAIYEVIELEPKFHHPQFEPFIK